jgi:hypothetical protein
VRTSNYTRLIGGLIAQNSSEQSNWKETALLEVIDEMRHIFSLCFENPVTAVIIRDLPIDFKTFRDVKTLLSITRVSPDVVVLIETGADELEQLIKDVRKYFLPQAKELMGISNLKPKNTILQHDQRTIRQLIICAFPDNLDRLDSLAGELKNILALIY